MGHRSHDYETARARCGKHTGAASKIREALADGPKTEPEIAELTGLAPRQIRSAANQMALWTGGIMRDPEDREKWCLFRKPGKSKGGGRVAGRIVIRGYRYGWGMLG